MLTNTKALFAGLVKEAQADCICDIGSRDGKQAILFRHLRPDARVFAFEANPMLFREMQSNPRLASERVEVYPHAISDREGTMDFFVVDVDYETNDDNRGMSSLFKRPNDKIKEVLKVQTFRIDSFLREHAANANRICLWIDAEGAEYFIAQGMSGLKDRVYALHVETALFDMVPNQKLYPEVKALLGSFGFVPCGDNIDEKRWGDVVFIRDEWRKELGFRFTKLKWKAYLTRWLRADDIAVQLKSKNPGLYHFLRRMFVKFA
jgi:FkbM family methyltransferase